MQSDANDVTDVTTLGGGGDVVMVDDYHGHTSKTVLFPLLLVVGTIGNVLSIVIFGHRKMRVVPVYGAFLVLAVCDVIILWLFSGSDWLVTTFNIDPYDTSQLSCQVLVLLGSECCILSASTYTFRIRN